MCVCLGVGGEGVDSSCLPLVDTDINTKMKGGVEAM